MFPRAKEVGKHCSLRYNQPRIIIIIIISYSHTRRALCIFQCQINTVVRSNHFATHFRLLLFTRYEYFMGLSFLFFFLQKASVHVQNVEERGVGCDVRAILRETIER